MLLIGQYDSPFVRRVGIAMTLYGMPFEHETWSAFGDADKIRVHNPLTRVPTLVLDTGEALTDSHTIIDYLDDLMPEERRMFPVSGRTRYQALRIAALAAGTGEKAVSLFYEKRLHKEISDVWVNRCTQQITGTLAVLEADFSERTTPYWFGNTISHADIVVAAVIRFIPEAHPGLVPMQDFPSLQSHATRMEALPAFRAIQQKFIPPA
ncbi:MAG: glutathione S-transferase family protein [Beijerinckiaceae bacterium]